MGCLTSPENRKSPLPEFILTGVKSLKLDLLDNLFRVIRLCVELCFFPPVSRGCVGRFPIWSGNLSRTCRHDPGAMWQAVRRWRPERSVFHGVAVCGGNDAMGGRLFDLHNRSPLTRPIAISDLLPFDPLLSARPGAVCGHSFLRMLSRSHSHSGISFQKNTMTA